MSGGRGGYPGQPVKHGGQPDHRASSIVPPKGPPGRSSGQKPMVNGHVAGRSGPIRQPPTRPPHRPDPLDCPLDIQEPATPLTLEVEHILKVILTAILS